MKFSKKIFFTLILLSLLNTALFAKETPLGKDAKTALKNYAGLSELKKRGFKLTDLDAINSAEEIYNILFPYMIKDGVPLDNVIGFYDKQNNQTFDFKQHYSVRWTDDYGTKNQLLEKGYKEDEIFAYFSKGANIYRGGKYEWKKADYFPQISQWMMPQFPPVSEKEFIYFWPAYYKDKFYPDYWKEAVSKDFIIIDFRLYQNDEYPISLFFDYLEEKKFGGEIIMIVDSSAYAGELCLEYRMTKWWNGQEIPRSFKYTVIGENTLGMSNFINWGNFESERIRFWGVRKEINKWKKFDEGVGVAPEIWAENAEDICKTVEFITGIKDFHKKIEVHQKYIDLVSNVPSNYYYLISQNKGFFELCDKNPSKYLEVISKFCDANTKWFEYMQSLGYQKFLAETTLLYNLRNKQDEYTAEEYIKELTYVIDTSIEKTKTKIALLKDDYFVNSLISSQTFPSDVKDQNRRTEAVFTIHNRYNALVKDGFDIHKMDYMTKAEDIIDYVQPFFLSQDGYPRDLHTVLSAKLNDGKVVEMKQTTRYVDFTNQYGSKEQLEKKGFVENYSMFYYPYHDGKYWPDSNNWRVGKMIMAFKNPAYLEPKSENLYYTTKKSIYFKFNHFAENEGDEPEVDEMIRKLAEEKGKENIIFDITANPGGDSNTTERICNALKKTSVKNVYILTGKGANSCSDHFALCSKDYYFKDYNVTLVGYPTNGGTASGDREKFFFQFDDFLLTIHIPTAYNNSETIHEGWGATPDVWTDNLTDALGALRNLTGDNELKPFEDEQRIKANKDIKRWLENERFYIVSPEAAESENRRGKLTNIQSISSDKKKQSITIKDIFSGYGAYPDLCKKGFSLSELDNVRNAQDLYKVLSKYMGEGKLVDNHFSFRQINPYIEYSFHCHKSVYFSDVYGTKDELLKKGYSEEELFYYPSKGKNQYRVGTLSWDSSYKDWEKCESFNINKDFVCNKTKKGIYFYIGSFNEWKTFLPGTLTKYNEDAVKAEYIVIDVRDNPGGTGRQIGEFCRYLVEKSYKGIIYVIQNQYSSSMSEALTDSTLRNYNLKHINIGENSYGMDNYGGVITKQIPELNLEISFPQDKNEAITFTEGIGIIPDAWAATNEDVIETVKFYTGDKDFKDVTKL